MAGLRCFPGLYAPLEPDEGDMGDQEVFGDGQGVDLLICTTCRQGQEIPEGGVRPGARLHEALSATTLPQGVRIHAVECLSNCSSGCSVVLRGGPKRWTYVYGNLDADRHAEVVADGVAKYMNTDDGLVPWRERPEHFRKNCIARIPPLEGKDVA